MAAYIFLDTLHCLGYILIILFGLVCRKKSRREVVGMEEALSLEKLCERVKLRYARDEQRVVGIMLARYDLAVTKDIVEQNYPYWHSNTGKYLDVFWAGYGAYLPQHNESPRKTILKFPGNTQNVYFDLDAFIEIKNQFNQCFKAPYRDTVQLILVNHRDGQLWFEESLKIDLEKNLDTNYARIREIMEFVTNECRYEHEVAPIAQRLRIGKFKRFIKGITVSDAISAAIGIAGLKK